MLDTVKNGVFLSALALAASLFLMTPSQAASPYNTVTVTARYYAEINDDFEVGTITLITNGGSSGGGNTAGYDFLNNQRTNVSAGAVYIGAPDDGRILWYGNNIGQGGVVRLAKLQSIIPSYSPTVYNRLGVPIVKDGVYAVYDQKNDLYIKLRVLSVATTPANQGGGTGTNPSLGVPSITQPTNNQTFTNYPRLVVLQWNAVANAQSYEIQVDCRFCRSTDGWQQVGTYTSNQTTFTPPSLPIDTEYRWHIRALDSSLRSSNWSDYNYFNFYTIFPVLTTPTFTTPTSGAVYTNFPRSLNVQWAATNDARSYVLEVSCSTCSGGNSPIVNYYFPAAGATSFPLTLTDDENHRIRIQSVDQHNNHSRWSEYVNFRFNTSTSGGNQSDITTAPGISIPNGTITVPSDYTSLNIAWNTIPNAQNYRVEVTCETCSNTTPWFHTYDTGNGVIHYILPLSDAPVGNHRYRIVVKGLKLPNVGPYSAPVFFNFNKLNPGPTPLSTPTNLTYTLDYPGRAADVSWNTVTGATNYLVEVNCNSCGSNYGWNRYLSIYSDNGSRTIRFRIPENKTYQVRVRAGNSSQTSPWSEYLTFTASAPTVDPFILATPTITSPTLDQNYTDASRAVTFRWNSVNAADEYQIQVSCDGCNNTAGWRDLLTKTVTTNFYDTSFIEYRDYTVRVRAYNRAVNVYSAWSPATSFRIMFQTRTVPRLLTPIFNQSLTNFPRRVTPTWTKIDNARRYIVEIDCDYCSGYTKWSGQPYRYVSQDYATSVDGIILPGDNEYRVRVRAVDQNGLEGPWSENSLFSFRT